MTTWKESKMETHVLSDSNDGSDTTKYFESSASAETGSSGYSSDEDASGEYEETDGSSYPSAFDPSSLSSSPSPYSSDSDSEDLDSQISFLREKQMLLKRASAVMKEQEAYDAKMARKILGGPFLVGSPIWSEAKQVLDDLEGRNDENTEYPVSKKPRVSSDEDDTSFKPRISLRDPNLPKIDISTVRHISSADVGDDIIGAAMKAVSKTEESRVPLTTSGPWMAKVLGRFLPRLPNTSRSWEVVDDPSLGPIVVPPSKISIRNRIELKDAVACSPVAQLIVQSTPPFRVVHMNKAFSKIASRAATDVIGKPIESLAQVSREFACAPEELSDASDGAVFMECKFLDLEQALKVSVIPVVDKSKSSQEGMTHLLIRMLPSDRKVTGGTSIVEAVSKKAHLHSEETLPVFGAVG